MSKLELHDEFDPAIPVTLPHENVYLIQVGYKLFRFSGASLSSDSPSYFTNFFLNPQNAEKVLYIDRNPRVFEKIFSHLQGYHINVEDAHEYVYLWSDSYYFGLRRLQKILDGEYTFACIGNESFKISKLLLARTNNYPNYFSINFESLLSDNKSIIQSKCMLRPPPQQPPIAPTRSAKLFADLLETLKGNDNVIKDDQHRQLLLRECRYYRFLGLEQRLLKHELVSNIFTHEEEIILNLFDIQSRGIVSRSTGLHDEKPLRYTRPYLIKEKERSLLVQVNSEPQSGCKLNINRDTHLISMICTGKIANAFYSVFGSFAKELSVAHQMEIHDKGKDKFVILCGLSNATTVLNGQELKDDWFFDWFNDPDEPLSKKRRASGEGAREDECVELPLTKSLWRILVRGDRCRFHAVSLTGYTNQAAFNKSIKML